MVKNPLISIIVIDYKTKNPYLIECLDAITRQSYETFEIILLTDYPCNLKYPKLRKKSYGYYVGPAEKRDDGVKIAKGEVVAFIDDDAYPDRNWLRLMVGHFNKKQIIGVAGPGVTPLGVSWQEEASGWASGSPIGAGPYTYRFLPSAKSRYVEDYPSMNLAVRRKDFLAVGGFDSHYWPGEDTKLCLDLTLKTGKKIIYDPKVLVYHHRRPILLPHLKQNGGFGLHRGYFAKILPRTSLRLVYFGPSVLVLGLFYLLFLNRLNETPLSYLNTTGWFLFKLYGLALVLNALWVAGQSKKLFQAIISIPVIFITHLWYGIRFLEGFLFTDKLVR